MQREAFTLIESLVVILVVSVLLAIVLPSLGRARELARETRCLASIRSAQQLVTAYAQDATDLPPHGAYESGSLASGHPSVAVMYTGIGGFGSDYFTQCYLWGTIVAYWQRDAVLGATCPGSPATMQSMRPPTSELIDSGTTSSYRLSAAFLASRSYWVSPAGAREIDFAPQRLAHVQYPARSRCFTSTMSFIFATSHPVRSHPVVHALQSRMWTAMLQRSRSSISSRLRRLTTLIPPCPSHTR
ncbi:MAG: prepilin-type N-terminal cleavage/methylation domain-containing protein [Phycisphaeraceae bacterium]|nr:prepilin-type N-terminal cleavage/methylation domain-containing protein [Phycisphaeraceae bacterium]